MAISRVKTWSSGEVLTASDLNAEYNNILNNPVDLWSPAGKAADFNGFEVILDADADTSITADTDDRIDVRLGAVDLFVFNGTTTSCVNGLTFFGTATGTPAYIRANGSDSNTGIDLRDANGNETLKTAAVASAVNEVTVTNAATGNPAIVAATGETNVSLDVRPKGSGTVRITDGTDVTKKAAFALSGITTASTRVITVPDYNVTLGQVTAKVGSFTRDVSTASGTQAVTGVGFTPKAIIFLAAVAGASRASWGMDDATTHLGIYDDHNTSASTWGVLAANSISLNSGGGATYDGNVSSMDSDGFTVTWTKNGSPTGTATIIYIAFR